MLKKPSRWRLLQCVFALYCCALLFLLFFSRSVWKDRTVLQHFQEYANLVPFRTILYQGEGLLVGLRYLFGKHHAVTWQLRYFGTNLLGNLVMLFPLGLLLPCIAKSCRHIGRFLLLTVMGIVAVEIAQTLLRVGVTDVDDIILNTVGAIGGFLTFKIPAVRRFLSEERS